MSDECPFCKGNNIEEQSTYGGAPLGPCPHCGGNTDNHDTENHDTDYDDADR